MPTEPPEYLPRPAGYEERVAALVAAGTPTADAHWLAACEAIGAVGRRETNHRDLFWHDETPDEQRDAWDRIADREGKRFYFHQRKDTLVGYLAYGRHKARVTNEMGREREESLLAFLKDRGLWDAWVDYNLARSKNAAKGNDQ